MALKKRLLFLSLILGVTTSSLVGCASKDINIVATTRNSQISSEALSKEMNFYRAMVELVSDQKLTTEQLNNLALNTVDYLITTEVLYEEGISKKLDASQEDIDNELKLISDFVDTYDTFKQALESSGFTEDDIKDIVSKAITADNSYEFIYKNISMSEADIENYYHQNKSTKYTQEYADASHILIKTIDENNQPLSDEKKADAKKKAEEVLKKVEAGEDFSKLAKEYSEDSSAEDGGELGKFTKGQMVQEFEDAAFALEPGKTSKIIETQYGYHIIKLNKKGTETLNYDDIASDVRQDFLDEKISNKITELQKKYKVRVNEEAINSTIDNLKPLKLDNNEKEDSSENSSKTNSDSNTSNSDSKNSNE